MRGLSLVVASGGHSSLRCAGLSLSRPLLLRSTGSRRAGSVVVAHGASCSAACGILPDQGANLCPLHWQADSQPLRHQGSPGVHLTWNLFSFLYRPFFILLCFADTVLLFFLQTEGVWQPCIKQVYWRHHSNSICSLHVSVTFWCFLQYFKLFHYCHI